MKVLYLFTKKTKTAIILVIAVLLIFQSRTFAQDTTAVSPIMQHSAHKATIYSLVLPGLGQAYNKKYWKIPIIYAGFGVLAYNIKNNNDITKEFTKAYRIKVQYDTIPSGLKYVKTDYDESQLLKGRDFYRRRVELSIIFTAAWYLLNVVDAAVDAHFFDYDVSENLSLNVKPVIINTPNHPLGTGGISLSMNFK